MTETATKHFFQLTDIVIDDARILELRAALKDARAGALIVFEGIVRNHNEGKNVRALAYEGYESLARAEAERIFAEAKSKFAIIDCLADAPRR